MSRPLFVDSSAWIALTSADDQAHAQARAYFIQEIQARRRRLLTTNFVLSETLTLLRYRFGLSIAETFWESVQQAQAEDLLEVRHIGEDLWVEAVSLFFRYRDQNFSFTDCTSFALMRREGIDTAFAFDHHFWVMGFLVEPANR
ncbi:MAG: PIN domain-containing protein [Fimbriimonadales bacterium]|nr:PIN domain-containing protein [Fimbriimonadales bacterium]